MTTPLLFPEPLDATRLPPHQSNWVRTLVNGCITTLESLTVEERSFFTQIWRHLASRSVPTGARHLMGKHLPFAIAQQTIARLNQCGLLWFDDDLKVILQCPPFSVLQTAHSVKAFGWESIFTTSFVDMPITLLVYGPNFWLEARTICPRSRETLTYRIKMREDHTLQFEAPPEASEWRVWVPLHEQSSGEPYADFQHLRSKINCFRTATDLAAYHGERGGVSGVVYTFEQALYLSNWLLYAYWQATKEV